MSDAVRISYDAARAAAYDAAHAATGADAEAAADLVAALADGGPVLELGVGTGRLALPLVRRGIHVTGVDASEAMVARLRTKPGGEHVEVVPGDFAEVAGLVSDGYAVVLLACSTLFELTTQQEQVRCVRGAASRLSRGGVFVVEAFAPDVTRVEQTVSFRGLGAGHLTLQVTRHDPVRQLVTGHDIRVGNGARRQDPFCIRYVTVPELDLMAELSGLRLRDRWGGWRGEPFDARSTSHVSVYESEEPWPASG